jgi:hypothetical protein
VRCKQCGYTTFDYLETCSKCRADLFEEKVRLNLPTGPFKPVSLSEIMARAAHPATEISPSPEDKTPNLIKHDPNGPKTFDLDLSDDTAMETLTDKLLAKSGGKPFNKEGQVSLNLSLE